MQVPGDPHRRFSSSYVFVDPLSGRVLAVHDIRKQGMGTAATVWIRALHDGSVGEMATRILALLLSLAPAMLFATGSVLHRLRRRRAVRAAPRA